ncbi:MAG: sulfatase [Acidobacteriota bacterium]|nr:sulfatase [Acidobacteriota bacterium]
MLGRRRPHRHTIALLAIALLAACTPPTTIDLVDELPGAQVHYTREMVDIGTAEARQFLVDGWGANETWDDGSTVVWSVGSESRLRFFLHQPARVRFVFRGTPVRFDGAPPQKIAVAINGKLHREIPVNGERVGRPMRAPASAVRAGVNELTLTYAYTRSPAELGRGSDERQLGVAWDWIRVEGGGGGDVEVDSSANLTIPVGTRVDYFFSLEGAARFETSRLASPRSGPRQLELEVELEGGEVTREIFEVRDPSEVSAEIGGPGLARLSLTAKGAAGGSVELSRPLLSVDARRRREYPASSGDAGAESLNVLVYLVDTLRADHLGCYGYERDTSPHLDAFAADATLFRNAMAQAPWTRPAVASIFTGLTPIAHGVNTRESLLPPEALTLPELFQAAGYDTVGIVTNPNLAEQVGFSQGFGEYQLTLPKYATAEELAEVTAEDVIDRFESWVRSRSSVDGPFFAYLHTGEPHGPYEPPAELRELYGKVSSDRVGSKGELRQLANGEVSADANHVAELLRLYDAEIFWNDRSFGRLIRLLRDRDLYDRTIIVFVSDHGEAFLDHGTWQHGKVLYREVIGVPLVIRFPGHGQGERVEAIVQHVDLMPTLLAAAGIASPGALGGRDLSRFIGDGRPAVAAATGAEIVSMLQGASGLRTAAISTSEWRLLEPWAYSSFPDPELYRWVDDPAEARDVAASHPLVVGYLRARLAKRKAAEDGLIANQEIELDPDIEKQLRAMGYL